MLKVRVIPLMLFNGLNIVKTIQFGQMRNLGNPTQFAKVYNNRDVDELIFIDLAATEENREPEYDVIAEVINECFMPLTVGGGIHSIKDVDRLIKIGADKISINSEAIKNPAIITEIAEKYGSQSIVVSIDAKKVNDKYYVFTDRGQINTGMEVQDWIKQVGRLGAGEVLLTSIDNDGVQKGYDLELIKLATQISNIPVIAAGGAGEVQDIIDVIKLAGANAVSLASMFHYTGHTANSIKERMSKSDIPVRLLREHYED